MKPLGTMTPGRTAPDSCAWSLPEEEIVIARAKIPASRLVPVGPADQHRLGIDASKFMVPADFTTRPRMTAWICSGGEAPSRHRVDTCTARALGYHALTLLTDERSELYR